MLKRYSGQRNLILGAVIVAFIVLLQNWTGVHAEEYESLDIKVAHNVEELTELLDNELLVTVEGDGINYYDYDRVWCVEVLEAGYIVVNNYYVCEQQSYHTMGYVPRVDSYLYKNKMLTNSIERDYRTYEIETAKYRHKCVSRYYVTPGTYYLQINGLVEYISEHVAISVAMLSSKTLLDVDNISYSDDYETATVNFRPILNNAIMLQILDREVDNSTPLFSSSVNEIERYDLTRNDTEEERNRIKEILNDGLEIKENGTYSLLLRFASDEYYDYPVSVTFTIDKLGSKAETIEAKSIKLNKKKATLKVGAEVELAATFKPKNVTDTTITWKTSNKKVATVDENGVVTAKKKGTCVITATTSNGKKAKCKLTVKK